MMDAIKINGKTYQWRLNLRAFNRAEAVYQERFTAADLSHITPGNLGRLIWVGTLIHEIKTGEAAPTLSQVLDWADERGGAFREFGPACAEAINQIWGVDEPSENSAPVATEGDDAPFLTGDKSTALDS